MSKVFKEEKGYVITGYVEADNKIIRNIILNCGFSALGIYLVILSHRNTNDGRCFPSLGTIASECSCKKKNIQNHIDKLINEGFLIVNSGKSGKANNYYFPLESFYKDEGKDAYKRIITKDTAMIEEVPATDDNIPSLAGECFDVEIKEVNNEVKEFKPVGKAYDDLFEDEELVIPQVEDNPLVGLTEYDLVNFAKRNIVEENNKKVIITDEKEKKKLFDKWFHQEKDNLYDYRLQEEIYQYSDEIIEEYEKSVFNWTLANGRGYYIPKWKKQDIAI